MVGYANTQAFQENYKWASASTHIFIACSSSAFWAIKYSTVHFGLLNRWLWWRLCGCGLRGRGANRLQVLFKCQLFWIIFTCTFKYLWTYYWCLTCVSVVVLSARLLADVVILFCIFRRFLDNDVHYHARLLFLYVLLTWFQLITLFYICTKHIRILARHKFFLFRFNAHWYFQIAVFLSLIDRIDAD